MAQLLAAFDARSVDPSQSAGALPVGKHPVIITNSEIKSTSGNDGGLLELTLSIIDGPAKGQSGSYRLNLYNKSPKAAEIAHRQLSAVCHVTSVYQLNDSSQLHNIPFIIDVGFQKGQGPSAPEGPENKGYTEVQRVFDIQGNEPGKQGAAVAQQQPQGFAQPAQQAVPAQGGGAPAWGQPAQQQAAPAAPAAWGQPAQQAQSAPAQASQAPAAPWGAAAPAAAAAPAGGAPWGR